MSDQLKLRPEKADGSPYMAASSERTEKLDRWLVLASLIGGALFLFFLNDEAWLHSRTKDGNQPKIGKILELQKDVRRRGQDDFVWLPVTSTEPIFLGDSIFTGPNSSASVQFDSGVKLWVDPDSLVVFDRASDLVKLDLRFGRLHGHLGDRANAGLKLNLNNQDLDLKGNSVEFFLGKEHLQDANLKVVEGVASLFDSKNNKELKLAKSQRLKLGRDIASINGNFSIDQGPVFVREDQWAMNRNIWFTQKQPLKFTWQAEGNVDHYELLISKHPEMVEPQIRETLKVNGYDWITPFDEGTIYWKVRAFGEKDQQVVESDVIQWNIGLLLPPEWSGIENPLKISIEDLRENKTETPPLLRWKSPLRTFQYRLQWSRTSDFAVLEEKELKGESWSPTDWKIGTYFARVRSEGLGRPASLWSTPLLITVYGRDPDGLVAPQWPVDEIETLAKIEKPLVSWSGQPGVTQYVVETSDRPDFSRVISSDTVKGEKWEGPVRPIGQYYLRLVPLAPSGRHGPVSDVLNWFARVAGPQWKPQQDSLTVFFPRDKNDKLLPLPPVRLAWSSLGKEKVRQYFIETGSDGSFSSAKVDATPSTDMTVRDLAPGIYFYRVRAQFMDGSLSLFSKTLKLEVSGKREDGLEPPVLLSKNLESRLEGGAPATVKLRWEKLSVTDQYRVELSEDANFKNIFQHKTVSATEVNMSFEKSGSFHLRVAGLSKKSKVGPWASVPWKISLGTPLIATQDTIKVVLPDASSPVPPTFASLKVEAPQELRHFFIEVAEGDNFTAPYAREKIVGRESRIRLTKAGKYQARVQALDSTGKELTPFSRTTAFDFVVSRPLKTPELLIPKEGVSYILAKMKNPQIWLEWDSDKLATSFQVEISKNKDFKKILHTIPSDEKRVLLDHKVVRGKLYWRVKAFNKGENLESPWSKPRKLSVVDIESED